MEIYFAEVLLNQIILEAASALVISVRFRAPHKEFSRPSRIILKLVVILI
jgi:hypothetical protein